MFIYLTFINFVSSIFYFAVILICIKSVNRLLKAFAGVHTWSLHEALAYIAQYGPHLIFINVL
jgi:hypothetical protein